MTRSRKPAEAPAEGQPQADPPAPEPSEPISDEADERPVGRHAASAVGERLRDAAERDEAAAEAEPEPEPEPPPAPDPTTVALGEANAAYITRVVEILGPDEAIGPCSSCSGLGFISVELKRDQHRERCEECGGLGVVDNLSQVEGQNPLACLGCQGLGWKLTQPTLVLPPIAAPTPAEQQQFTPPVVPAPASVIS